MGVETVGVLSGAESAAIRAREAEATGAVVDLSQRNNAPCQDDGDLRGAREQCVKRIKVERSVSSRARSGSKGAKETMGKMTRRPRKTGDIFGNDDEDDEEWGEDSDDVDSGEEEDSEEEEEEECSSDSDDSAGSDSLFDTGSSFDDQDNFRGSNSKAKLKRPQPNKAASERKRKASVRKPATKKVAKRIKQVAASFPKALTTNRGQGGGTVAVAACDACGGRMKGLCVVCSRPGKRLPAKKPAKKAAAVEPKPPPRFKEHCSVCHGKMRGLCVACRLL